MQITVQRMRKSPSFASYCRTDPFLRAAVSAYTRVIADVAIVPVRGRRRKCADARRRNAGTVVTITGGGRGVRIDVPRMVPRGYMTRASHSRGSDHGYGDQCGRQKVMTGHSTSPMDMRSQQRLAPQDCGFSFQRPRRLMSRRGRQDSVSHQSGDQTGDRFIPCPWMGISINDRTFA